MHENQGTKLQRQERQVTDMDALQLKKQINELLKNRKFDNIKKILLSHKNITEHDNDLAMVCYLCTIYEQEKAAGQETLFSKVSDIEELLGRYTLLKFYLRRIDFGVMDEIGMFYKFLSQNQVSSYELLRVMDFSVVHRERVLQVMNGGAQSGVPDADSVKDAESRQEATGRNRAERGDEEEPGRSMDDSARDIGLHTVCFILCTNHPEYARECIYYIQHLNVPEGFQTEILTVEEAASLAAGYNEAMQCSQAKYKVYLHHDTFIVNSDFIKDCLDIFQENPQIGMLGNVGVKKMPASGVMWDADRYGMLYEQHIYETELLSNAFDSSLAYLEVDAIDGFIMVTQYDLPWREDLFDKWDFYDCSQSMEFIRHGYRVVVPNMKEPWCVHDCGFINLDNYDSERKKFVAEYM